MKKILVFIAVLLALSFVSVQAFDDVPDVPQESGVEGDTPDDEAIETDTVEKQNTDEVLDSDTVEAVPTKTPKPAPTATQRPTPKPTPKPKVVKKATPRPTPTETAVPTSTPVLTAEFTIQNTKIEELAKKRTPENLYGIFDKEKKVSVLLTIQSTGNKTLKGATAEMKSGHQRLLVLEPLKDLTTILPGDKRELLFTIDMLSDYDGVSNLPLSLLIKAEGFEKEYPLSITVEQDNLYVVYAAIGALCMLFLILLLLLFRKKDDKKTKKYDDFNIK